jgi:hypothetical protein
MVAATWHVTAPGAGPRLRMGVAEAGRAKPAITSAADARPRIPPENRSVTAPHRTVRNCTGPYGCRELIRRADLVFPV